MTANPDWEYCWRRYALHDHQCQGRITTEHAMIHHGRQVNEVWAIIRICAWAHEVDQFQDGGGLNKEINEWIALTRLVQLPKDELIYQMRKYPTNKWMDRLKYLTKKYGSYTLSTV